MARADERQAGGDHYKRMTVQPWNVVDTWSLAEQIGFYRGNAVKYLMRLHDKDDEVINAEKAAHYVEKLIEVLKPPVPPHAPTPPAVDIPRKLDAGERHPLEARLRVAVDGAPIHNVVAYNSYEKWVDYHDLLAHPDCNGDLIIKRIYGDVTVSLRD